MLNSNYVSPIDDKNWKINNTQTNKNTITITLHNPNVKSCLDQLDEEGQFNVEMEMWDEIDGHINIGQIQILELINELKGKSNELQCELKCATLESGILLESFRQLLEQQTLIFANI